MYDTLLVLGVYLMKKTIIVFILLILLLPFSFFLNSSSFLTSADSPPLTELELLLGLTGGISADEGHKIQDYLSDIGIDLTITTAYYIPIIDPLSLLSSSDLALIKIDISSPDPKLGYYFFENASRNYFGLDSSLPYGSENEQLLTDGPAIMDFAEKQQHYFTWQQLFMDKVIPILPLYSSQLYASSWSNLHGFNYSWGLASSLPYMYFDGFHPGQSSSSHFNTALFSWVHFDPFMSPPLSWRSDSLLSFLMEPIIHLDPNGLPTPHGLVHDWVHLSPSHVKFTLREGIYWNPSNNISSRDGSSPLSNASLMPGFNGQVSTGDNQEVTAKDAVFTLLAWSTNFTHSDPLFHWFTDIYIDPSDPYSFHIHLPSNSSTDTSSSFSLWQSMSVFLLPDFFLNDTSSSDVFSTPSGISFTGLYPGITDTSQWQSLRSSIFGCGKYMLDYYLPHDHVFFQSSPYWFGIGAIDGSEQDLAFKTIKILESSSGVYFFDEFISGLLDFTHLSSNLSHRPEILGNTNSFHLYRKPSRNIICLAFNLNSSFIGGKDNHVFLDEPGYEQYTKALAGRKAIGYAINRTEMKHVAHKDDYLLCDSPIPLTYDYWYFDDIIKYHRNLTAALDWLSFAGYEVESPKPAYFYLSASVILLLFVPLIKKKRVHSV